MIKWKLNKLMIARGIQTYRDLSESSGLPHVLIAAIGHNKMTTVSLNDLDTLCRTLQCMPAELLEYTAY